MKPTNFIMPVFFLVVSVIYFILTLNLPKAKLNDPNAPMYFPLLVSVFLFFVSLIYLINVIRKGEKDNEDISKLLTKRVLYLSLSTLGMCIVYALLFLRIGFLPSTLIFLGALLFIVNGKKKWPQNIIVTVVFSFATWYAFSELLHVSLP